MEIYNPRADHKALTYLNFILFIVCSSVFLISLFSVAIMIIGQYFLAIDTPRQISITSLSSQFGNYLAIIIVTFPLVGILLVSLRNSILKGVRVLEHGGFKFLYYLSFVVPTILIVGYLISTISALLTGTFTSELLIKFGVLILFLTPIIILLKSIANKPPSLLIAGFFMSYYFLVSALVFIFAFIKIGPPWLSRDIRADQNKIAAADELSGFIQDYFYQFRRIPKGLDELKNTYTDEPELKRVTGEYEYSITGDNSYKICSSFKFSSDEMQKYGYTSQDRYTHSKGFACFDFTVAKELCKSIGTTMVVGFDGKGQIGCDIEVNGRIDLGKSYCEGQATQRKEFLVPDAYGRQNRYFATLTGLDMNEEVKIFAYTLSGAKVECLPSLNK